MIDIVKRNFDSNKNRIKNWIKNNDIINLKEYINKK